MTRSIYTDGQRQAFGQAFGAALDASGLNPPALAERLDVTDDAVRKWRKGMVPSGRSCPASWSASTWRRR